MYYWGFKLLRLNNVKYEHLKQEVADIIETYGINVYPFNVGKLAHKIGIQTISYKRLNPSIEDICFSISKDGFTIWVHNQPYIFFNSEICCERLRFSLAHEIAHIWLEHTKNSEENEAEANFFTAYLLAPIPLIKKYKLSSPADISRVFNISSVASQHACDRAKKRLSINAKPAEYESKIINLCSLNEEVVKLLYK